MIDERNAFLLATIVAGWIIWKYLSGMLEARRLDRKKKEAYVAQHFPPKIDHCILFLPYRAFSYDVGCIPDHVKSPEVHPFIDLLNDQAKVGWQLIFMDRATQMLIFRKAGSSAVLFPTGISTK